MDEIYIITGICGFLGNTTAGMLAAEGCRVRGLALPGEDASMLPETAEVVRGDVCLRGTLDPLFEGIPEGTRVIVIHTAGIISIDDKPGPRLYEVNVGGTMNVVNACIEHKIDKLVHVSSVHAIPELPMGVTMREITSFDPERVSEPYSKSKAEATKYVLAAAKRSGLDVSVVHPSGIIGPGDSGRGLMGTLVTDYLAGALPAAVTGGYDFVDVRDVARGIISAARSGGAGECYLLSGSYISVRELLGKLHEITGKTAVRLFLPLKFVMVFTPAAALVAKLRGERPLFTHSALRILGSNAAFSHEKATSAFGYRPRPIEETLRDTVEFLHRIGKIKLKDAARA